MWSIAERLWLGNIVSGERALLEASGRRTAGPEIVAVVSLCAMVQLERCGERVPANPDVKWLHLPIADGGCGVDEFLTALALGLPFVRRERQRGGVLVHCLAGVSRSPSFVAAALCDERPELTASAAFAVVAVAKARALGLDPTTAQVLAPAEDLRRGLARYLAERRPHLP